MEEKQINKYFKDYFEETEKITEWGYFKEKDINGNNHFFEYNYTKNDILKIILSFSKDIKYKIMEKFIYIDFKNGDIMHFIDYLLKGYCEGNINQQVKVIEENKSLYI